MDLKEIGGIGLIRLKIGIQLESPCECDIQPLGCASHGVSKLPIFHPSGSLRAWNPKLEKQI